MGNGISFGTGAPDVNPDAFFLATEKDMGGGAQVCIHDLFSRLHHI